MEAKNPLADVELTDEDAIKLQGIQKDIARADLIVGTRHTLLQQPSAMR